MPVISPFLVYFFFILNIFVLQEIKCFTFRNIITHKKYLHIVSDKYDISTYSCNIIKRDVNFMKRLYSSVDLNHDDEPEDPTIDNTIEVDDDKKAIITQLYFDLCDGSSYLTKAKFREWEDIKELLADGVFDNGTLEVIYEQVEIVGDVISVDQFILLVELVNQVSDVLEGDISIEDFEKLGLAESNDINDYESDDQDTDEKYKWLFDSISDIEK